MARRAPIRIDVGEDGDWIKGGTWDLRAKTADELRDYLAAVGLSIEHFKTLVVYRANVERLPWLAEL